jgi:hypothetical protein
LDPLVRAMDLHQNFTDPQHWIFFGKGLKLTQVPTKGVLNSIVEGYTVLYNMLGSTSKIIEMVSIIKLHKYLYKILLVNDNRKLLYVQV